MANERFGKYTLLERLAKGGMGETMLAEQVGAAGVSRRVVLKMMLPQLMTDPVAQQSFIQEARISATLSHGNIAQVYEFGEVDGTYFLAMEHVNGRSLQRVLERATKSGFGPLPFAVSAFVTLELLKALHYAHTRVGADGERLGLIHRDISPDNVLLSFEGEVKLVDFGVAKASMKGRAETEPGLVKGKYRYLSPEQALAQPLDARSDLFSAGILLYEMLSGERPFAGIGHAVMEQIVTADPPPLKVRRPDMPDELDAIVLKALSKQRDGRYATALEMQEALARWLYRQVPDFSGEVVRELMGQLFTDDLVAAGTPFQSNVRATQALRAIRTREGVPTQPSHHAVTRDEKPVVASGDDGVSKRLWLGVGFAAAATALLVLWLYPSSVPSRPMGKSIETCLVGHGNEPVPPHLDTLLAYGTNCLDRNLNVNEQQFVERWLCAWQIRNLDAARALAEQGNLEAADDTLRFEPLSCSMAQVTALRAQVHERHARASVLANAQDRAAAAQAPAASMDGGIVEALADETSAAAVQPGSRAAPALQVGYGQRSVATLLNMANQALKVQSPQSLAYVESLMNECLKVNSAAYECSRLLGVSLMNQGRFRESATAYQAFLTYAPKDHPQRKKVKDLVAQYSMSFTIEDTTGLEELEKAAARRPQGTNIGAAGNLFLGQAKQMMKVNSHEGYVNAAQILRECVALEKTNAECHKQLGMALSQLGDSPGAKKELELYFKYSPPGTGRPQK